MREMNAVAAAPEAARAAAPEHVQVATEPATAVLLVFPFPENLREASTEPQVPSMLAAAAVYPVTLATESPVAQRVLDPLLIGQTASIISAVCLFHPEETGLVGPVEVTVAQHAPVITPRSLLQSVVIVGGVAVASPLVHANFPAAAAHFVAIDLSAEEKLPLADHFPAEATAVPHTGDAAGAAVVLAAGVAI